MIPWKKMDYKGYERPLDILKLLEKPIDDVVYVDKGHIMKDLAGPAKKHKHDSPCRNVISSP